MRNVSKFVIAAIVFLPVAALAADSVQMTAGRWQEVYTVTAATLDGKPMSLDLFKGKTTFSCIGREAAAEPRLYFTFVRAGGHCEQPQGTVANGRLALTTQCGKDVGRPMDMEIQGSYGRESYRITGVARGLLQGRPMTMNVDIDGKFLGQCKGDES